MKKNLPFRMILRKLAAGSRYNKYQRRVTEQVRGRTPAPLRPESCSMELVGVFYEP